MCTTPTNTSQSSSAHVTKFLPIYIVRFKQRDDRKWVLPYNLKYCMSVLLVSWVVGHFGQLNSLILIRNLACTVCNEVLWCLAYVWWAHEPKSNSFRRSKKGYLVFSVVGNCGAKMSGNFLSGWTTLLQICNELSCIHLLCMSVF